MIKALVISYFGDTKVTKPEVETIVGLKKLGVDITVMTLGEAESIPYLHKNGVKTIDFYPVKKYSFAEMKIIRKELKTGKYNILHLYNNRSIRYGIVASFGLKVKLIAYRGLAGNIHWYDPSAYLKFLNPRISKIICASEATTKVISDNLFWKKDKAITVIKGHLLSWYSHAKNVDLTKYNIPKNAFVVVNVANARKMKGIEYLLNSSNYLPENLPIHYILIGRGIETEEHIEIVKKSKYKNNIHFLGFRKDALNFIKSSNVFVLSSINGEAVNKAVIEAMAVGTAPIITDIPGNKGMVKADKSGIIVPIKNPKAIADAILKLYNNRDLCKLYAKNSKINLENNFNIKSTIEKTFQIYSKLSK